MDGEIGTRPLGSSLHQSHADEKSVSEKMQFTRLQDEQSKIRTALIGYMTIGLTVLLNLVYDLIIDRDLSHLLHRENINFQGISTF